MQGLRKKIMSGFISLALLLFFAATFSFWELQRMSRETQELLDASARYTRLSREMLDAIQEQNASLLSMIMQDKRRLDTTFIASRLRFDHALIEATVTVRDLTELDAIYQAYRTYEETITTYIEADAPNTVSWFVDIYRSSYADLTTVVKNYMSASQYTLSTQASLLKGSAYRAITPSIMTLGVAMIVVLLFCFLIDLYFIHPVIRINKSLWNYLNNKLPFSAHVEGHDEVYRLREAIETLIQMVKNKRPE